MELRDRGRLSQAAPEGHGQSFAPQFLAVNRPSRLMKRPQPWQLSGRSQGLGCFVG